MSKIEVEIYLDQKVEVSLHVQDIIAAINEQPIADRWNCMAQILNGISNDAEDLTESQRDFVIKYLHKKLELFTPINQPGSDET